MNQGGRADEETTTQRRAQVLGLHYVDTTQLQKQLYKTVLTVPELYKLRVVPLTADEHNIHFGITTTTPQQTINQLKGSFTDYITKFSLISDSGYREYMKLYDPPKQVEYHDITLSETDKKNIIETVSKTLEEVRPDDMLAYLVQQAYKLKASDIHLETQKENTRCRFRIDGVLRPIFYLSRPIYDGILKEIIKCSGCGKAYRIIEMEFAFYRRIKLPIPRLCPTCRFNARFKFVNPPKFWPAKCQCAGKTDDRKIYTNQNGGHTHGATHCPNAFETSYAPDRPDIIYCEQCYNAEAV